MNGRITIPGRLTVALAADTAPVALIGPVALAVLVAIGAVAGGFAGLACQRPQPLPVLHEVTDFQLTEASGVPFGKQNLSDRYHLVDFIFTECPLACPTMTHEMKRLYEEFPSDKLGFVSISVDPVNDTLEVLRRYRERLGVDPERWKFLRGDLDTVRAVSEKGFLIAASELPYGHSVRFILVDEEARIRGFYQSDDSDELKRLRRDLKTIR